MIHNRLMGRTTTGNKGCRRMSEFRYFIKIYAKRTYVLLSRWYYGALYDDFCTKCMANSTEMDR